MAVRSCSQPIKSFEVCVCVYLQVSCLFHSMTRYMCLFENFYTKVTVKHATLNFCLNKNKSFNLKYCFLPGKSQGAPSTRFGRGRARSRKWSPQCPRTTRSIESTPTTNWSNEILINQSKGRQFWEFIFEYCMLNVW